MSASEIILLTVLILSLVAGFIAVFFNAGGTWIIFFGSLFFAFATHFTILSVKTVGILTVLLIVGEIAENILSYFGIKKMGGTNRSVFGAFAGGIMGGILGSFLFGVGVILGGLLGVFLGAYLMEVSQSGDHSKSFKVGIGGLLGVLGSVIAKIIIALVMIEIVVSHLIHS